MIGRLTGFADVALAAATDLVAATRAAASGCVSAQAGRAVAQVDCDDDVSVAAGHLGGTFVTIEADDPVAPLPLPVQHPIPKPVAAPKPTAPTPKPEHEAPPIRGEARPDRNGADPGDTPPRGGAQGDDLTVELDCDAVPETTRLTNHTSEPITVQEINPTSGEPITRDDTIAPGESITYQSGDNARGRFDLGPELYDDDDDEAKVLFNTSGGDFSGFCFAS